jgi:hypothetical protein
MRDSAGVLVVENAGPESGRWVVDSAGAIPLQGLTGQEVEHGSVVLAGNQAAVAAGTRVASYDLRGTRQRIIDCGLESVDTLLASGAGGWMAWDGQGLAFALGARGGCGAPRRLGSAVPSGVVAPLGVLSNGTVIVAVRDARMFRVAALPARDTVQLYRIALREGAAAEHFLAMPGPEQLTWGGGQGAIRLAPPFPRDAFAAVAGGRTWIADAATAELRGYDAGGRLAVIARAPFRGDPVDPEEAARWRSRLARLARGYLDPGERQRLEAGLVFPIRYAPFTALLATEGGELWLRAGTAPGRPRRWDVFDARGTWRAEVYLPAGFDLLAAGGRRIVARRRARGGEDELVLAKLAR